MTVSTKLPLIPQIVVWAAGAVAAYSLVRFVKREYDRVNAELESARLATVASKSERDKNPTLRRDPRTGVYRP